MELYWILRLPAINDISQFVCGAALVLLFILFPGLGICSDYERDYQRILGFIKWTIGILVVFGIIFCLTPTRKDLALMLGWDAIKSDSVQDVVEIIKDRLIK